MKEMKRRDFLKLARDTSLYAVVPGALRYSARIAPLLTKYTHIDLDYASYFASELEGHFQKGNSGYVLREAKRYFAMLEQIAFPADITRVGEIQMRFGMLYAHAQESVLPWYERASPTINIYNHLEERVLPKLLSKSYPVYHAQLLARRAPLYREKGNLRKSLEQFTMGLKHCLSELSNDKLLVELYYSRAHIWAIVGDEQRWQADFTLAKECAQKANDISSNLLRLITYTEGEGYKRLAYNTHLELTQSRRIWYATRGIACFKQSHMEKSQWVGHPILSGVAEAQCLILMEPDEAIRRAKDLRGEAQRVYPAMVQKIDRTISAAQRYLH